MHLGLVTRDAAAAERAAGRLRAAGAADVVPAVLTLTGDPVDDRRALDAVLDAVAGRRIALDLPLGDLGALLHRMMRRGEIETTETALLGAPPPSLARVGLTGDPTAAAALAVRGPAHAVGLLKDDSGGVLIDSARLSAWPGADGAGPPFWLRAYVDDTAVCDGPATALVVQRLGRHALRATATRPGLLRRDRAVEGRALQLACDDAQIVADGVPRERPRDKRTWWCEPTYWKVALPI